MTETTQVHAETIFDESKPSNDEQRIMRKLQHEYYMSVRESPDLLRTPSLEDLARLSRKQVIRKKSFDRQKSESRQQTAQQEFEKRRLRTSEGKASHLRGAYHVPPEVQLAKDEILEQIRTEAERVKMERHALKSTRLRVVHEELTTRKPRVNHRASLPTPTSFPPEFQALREEIKKYRNPTTTGSHSHLQAASKLRAVHEELTSRSHDQEAALKYDAPESSTRAIRRSRRRRSKSDAEAATPGRASRAVLIPKTSPLARYKMQWSSRSVCSSSPGNSCCSSMDGIDEVDMEYLNTPSTSISNDHNSDIDAVDLTSVAKSERNSEEDVDGNSLEAGVDGKSSVAGQSPNTESGSSMDLSELALTLSCLLSSVNVKETFESSSHTTSSKFLTNSARSA